MALKNQDIEMYQRENKLLLFSIVDSKGINKVLTGGKAKFVINNANFVPKTTENGGINIDVNVARIILESNDTLNIKGVYNYELRVIDSDNISEVASTGRITILNSIS